MEVHMDSISRSTRGIRRDGMSGFKGQGNKELEEELVKEE